MENLLSQEDIDALLGVAEEEPPSPEALIIQKIEEFSPYIFIPNMLFYIMIAKDQGVLALISYLPSDDPHFDAHIEAAIDGQEPMTINANISSMKQEHEKVLNKDPNTQKYLKALEQKFELMTTTIEAIQQGYDLPKAAQLFQWNLDQYPSL